MGKYITDYLLYRWRYILGYTLIGLVVLGLLVVAGLYIPGGLSNAETLSVVKSSSLSIDTFEPSMIVNLPYQVMQRISIDLFGVSNLSIKLPSLVLGLVSILGMIILLRTWFHRNVAIIATVLVVTTGQFLFVAQSGTTSIIYVFWSVWLLAAAMMVSRHARPRILWKIILFMTAALSLYTPLSIYILLALISAVILHPHLRYIVRNLSKAKVSVAVFFALVAVAPLAYAIVKEPSVSLTLLGVPEQWPNLWANALQLLQQYFNFMAPSSGTLMLPVYGLGSIILIALGIFHLFTTKYMARSYVISCWVILLLPILIINPRFTSVTFVPALLLMAMGIYTLLRSWYRLFPRNPYARIAGLVPLAILIGGMLFSGINRYTYGYLYTPSVTENFSKDLRLVNKQLADESRGSTTLIVAESEIPFYTVVAAHNQNVAVNPATDTPVDTVIVSQSANDTRKNQETPAAIITSASTRDADRFYIYKSSAK
jgi:dolichyl-phosphate-mannose-protein mannosyltransferase